MTLDQIVFVVTCIGLLVLVLCAAFPSRKR